MKFLCLFTFVVSYSAWCSCQALNELASSSERTAKSYSDYSADMLEKMEQSKRNYCDFGSSSRDGAVLAVQFYFLGKKYYTEAEKECDYPEKLSIRPMIENNDQRMKSNIEFIKKMDVLLKNSCNLKEVAPPLVEEYL